MSERWDGRFAILLADAERKIIGPLRDHGWTIHSAAGVDAGEYLVIDAERSEQRHKVALLYTSATDNAVYKRLVTEVEHIYVRGQLYKVESYAYGITIPVTTLDTFHSQLLDWNAASATGKFAPGPDVKANAQPSKHRILLSETPIEAVWLRLRQLGSVTLARKLVETRAAEAAVKVDGVALAAKAEGLAFALRNATDYFHAREVRNVSQRVLNLYYGTMSFAFAEMLAAPNGPATLAEIEDSTKQGHGLFTVDGEKPGLEHIVVGVIATGFFSTWARFLGHSVEAFPKKKPKTYAEVSEQPATTWVTIEQLFARIPEISDLFFDVFDSKPAWLKPVYDLAANPVAPNANDTAPSSSISYARFVDESTRLTKEDVAAFPGPFSQISEVPTESGRQFRVAVDKMGQKTIWDVIAHHRSPFSDTASLILPVFGSVAEYRAISLVLLYAMSIIVRYRPSVWRRVQEGDLDHLRVLTEAFLAVVERVLPEQFLEQVTGHRTFVKQPGSFW